MATGRPHIEVKNLTMAYGQSIIQTDLNFAIGRGEIFVVMGGSGCGKSTLLRHLVGLQEPLVGAVFYGESNFWEVGDEVRDHLRRRAGVLYQSGALWSSLTLAENVALPLREHTDLEAGEIAGLTSYKLALVGLAGFEQFYPAEISGGMRKRAGLARAMALDPEVLFFDEPSAGLDPVSARRLDELIIELRDSLGTTVVVVSHDLASIFAIGDNSIFLDGATRKMIASGDPRVLRDHCDDLRVREFLTRGEGGRRGGGSPAASGLSHTSSRQA